MFLDSTQLIAKDQERRLADIAPKIPKKARDAIDWDLVLKTGNLWYDRIVKPMRQRDPVKRRKELDALDAATQKWIKSLKNFDASREKDLKTAVSKAIANVMLALMLPAIEQLQEAENRASQRWHNIQLAFALEMYRKDNGRYPPKLSDLTPKILKAIPADVFSGKPLIYRAKRDSYLLYSIGRNGRDDAGRYYDDEPQGDDIRVRMPARARKK